MYVRVHAVPGARKENVTKIDETTFNIKVREPAERNLANGRIRELLAREFRVSVPQVTMLTGHRSSSKMYSIEV
jgi:uncharacterized protein YggU (UPF0235/DUF167 family)